MKKYSNFDCFQTSWVVCASGMPLEAILYCKLLQVNVSSCWKYSWIQQKIISAYQVADHLAHVFIWNDSQYDDIVSSGWWEDLSHPLCHVLSHPWKLSNNPLHFFYRICLTFVLFFLERKHILLFIPWVLCRIRLTQFFYKSWCNCICVLQWLLVYFQKIKYNFRSHWKQATYIKSTEYKYAFNVCLNLYFIRIFSNIMKLTFCVPAR